MIKNKMIDCSGETFSNFIQVASIIMIDVLPTC